MKIFPHEFKTDSELDVETYYVEIKKSSIPGAGLGVFAKKDIHSGKDLGFYRGEWLTAEDYSDGKRTYTYTLGLSNGILIDAEHNAYNWVSRVNTPKGTNMKTNIYWDTNGRVFAKRNIKAGEELFVAYGQPYWRSIKKNSTIKNKSKRNNRTRNNTV